jgi:hypothetical protein
MIWGESYAGVYVPTLALAVYKSDLDMRLTGFAVGNPCTDDATQFGLMGYAIILAPPPPLPPPSPSEVASCVIYPNTNSRSRVIKQQSPTPGVRSAQLKCCCERHCFMGLDKNVFALQ